MVNQEQKIEVIRQMLEEKIRERELLVTQIETIHMQIKKAGVSINAFQNELEKLTGHKIVVRQVTLRGAEIGPAAIEALKRLGGRAHYTEVKAEIEKHYTISGVNDKSKADSVWNQLNKSDLATKLGGGVFMLRD